MELTNEILQGVGLAFLGYNALVAYKMKQAEDNVMKENQPITKDTYSELQRQVGDAVKTYANNPITDAFSMFGQYVGELLTKKTFDTAHAAANTIEEKIQPTQSTFIIPQGMEVTRDIPISEQIDQYNNSVANYNNQ